MKLIKAEAKKVCRNKTIAEMSQQEMSQQEGVQVHVLGSQFMAKLKASGYGGVSRWYRKVCNVANCLILLVNRLAIHTYRSTLSSKTCSWLLLIMEDVTGHS